MKAIPIVIAIILIAIVAVIVIGVTGGFDCGGTPTPTPTPTITPTTSPTPTPTSTPTPTPTPTPLTPPIVTDISPDTFHQGEMLRLAFSLENQSPLLYDNVYVFCYSVDKEGETWTQPVKQASGEVTMPGSATTEVTVEAETAGDQTPGTYTLSYYIHFTGEGDREFETRYDELVTVQ